MNHGNDRGEPAGGDDGDAVVEGGGAHTAGREVPDEVEPLEEVGEGVAHRNAHVDNKDLEEGELHEGVDDSVR